MILSKRAQALKPSPTLLMAARAQELQSKGHDVISLTVGEPDWGTFQVAAEAGIKAINDGFTKYTPAAGIPALKKAIISDTEKWLGLTYDMKQVCVGAGAKFILFSALQMILNQEDEVLIPSPYWVSYPAMTELAGGKSVVVPTEEKTFKVKPSDLDRFVSKKTRILILCSPSNPTGMVYSKSELEEIAMWLNKHPEIFVISDDIYNRLLFSRDGVAPHLLHVAPELQSRVLVVNGASKSYAMTGWRVGWGLGPDGLMKAIADFMSQSTSNVTSISQMAATAALLNGEAELQETLLLLSQRKAHALTLMKSLNYFVPSNPQGAFYLWVDVKRLFGKACQGTAMKNSKDVAEVLLNQYFVATVPGIEFGTEGYLRLSLAVSEQQMNTAIDRLKSFESALA